MELLSSKRDDQGLRPRAMLKGPVHSVSRLYAGL